MQVSVASTRAHSLSWRCIETVNTARSTLCMCRSLWLLHALPGCPVDTPCTRSSPLPWRRVYTSCFVREHDCRQTPTQVSVVLETRLHLALCAQARFQYLRSAKSK
ncbi:hypothetical protein NDU88_000597 [Pleurodeles waltl]|uniref:Secreted protein n=1 Tax=Pleurodeles waltl TaxID=8319 RepID=A0AAV7TFI7_PLEWA|nr:hypothetical protein NDU88_000597 [Pleurodeles waltl]